MSAGQAVVGRVAAAPRVVVAVLPVRLRRWLLFLLALCALVAAGYQFWLRDSSLVAVEEVAVTGLTTKDAPRVRAALESAARTMTTLHLERAELERAIAAYPVVRTFELKTDFPHGLTIRVIEHRPAAMVDGLPVAGDGTILRGLPAEGELPTIDSRGAPRGNRLTDSTGLHAARVAGAAPLPLLPRVEHVAMRSDQGIVVELRDGPELIFGDATQARAKWVAAGRVLADPEAAGATYIDVRLPGRPAAGGLPATTLSPVAPAGTTDPAATTDPALTAPPAAADPATEQLAPPPAQAPAEGTAPAESPAAPAPAAPPAAPETAGGGAGPAPSG